MYLCISEWRAEQQDLPKPECGGFYLRPHKALQQLQRRKAGKLGKGVRWKYRPGTYVHCASAEIEEWVKWRGRFDRSHARTCEILQVPTTCLSTGMGASQCLANQSRPKHSRRHKGFPARNRASLALARD